MEHYDIIVIGGGPAGYAAAMRAIDFGKKTLLLEKAKVGGAGLYNGVLTSKTMWELSKDVRMARKRVKKYSTCSDFQLNYDEVKRELANAVEERKNQLEGHLAALKEEGYHDTFFHEIGAGKLLNNKEVEITYADGNSKVVSGENIVLATGSRPRYLPNIPIDEDIIVTSDGIHAWEELPKSMVVLGAGVIGCEYATIYASLGQTKVNIIDKADHILPFEDEDIVGIVEDKFEIEGIHVHKNSSLIRMEKVDGMVEYELEFKNGKREVFRVEKALVSVGRVPNTEHLGLANTKVKLTDRGAIENDDTLTDEPNIYAIGDLTADVSLVNVGELEGRHAIKRIIGSSDKRLSYDHICSIMFLHPLIASVGLNEKQAQAKGISYQVVTMDYSVIARGICMRNPAGFFKILVTNDSEMKLIGMRAVGPQASSAIQAVGLLISQGQGVESLAELIHPHPSLIEGIQECCRMLLGKSILKPHVFGDAMKYKGYMASAAEFQDKAKEKIRVKC